MSSHSRGLGGRDSTLSPCWGRESTQWFRLRPWPVKCPQLLTVILASEPGEVLVQPQMSLGCPGVRSVIRDSPESPSPGASSTPEMHTGKGQIHGGFEIGQALSEVSPARLSPAWFCLALSLEVGRTGIGQRTPDSAGLSRDTEHVVYRFVTELE